MGVIQVPTNLATPTSPGEMSAEQVKQVATAYAATAAPFVGPVNLILDVDFGQDADDIGALAVAHRLCDLGEVQIIAMANSFSDVAGARGIAAINAFYGRPEIPVGLGGIVASQDYYLSMGASFPNRLSAATPPTAVSVYRKALAAAPDGSVVWYVQGPMTILAGVVASAADSISPMTGLQLMAAKLSKVLILGGNYPGGGAEYDLNADPTASQVINSLSTLLPSLTVVFQGAECGINVHTNSGQPVWSPVREDYDAFFRNYGGTERPSWGALGVLYCVRGLSTYFTLSAAGTCTVDGSGNNTWTAGASGPHRYLVQSASDATLEGVVQALQDAIPSDGNAIAPYRAKSMLTTYSFATWPTTAARNDFTGAIGFNFKLSVGKTVTRLGRLYVTGNTQNHVVKLWKATGAALLASGTVLASSLTDRNGFKWIDVAPVDLEPNTEYRIAVDEANAGDTFKDDWVPVFPWFWTAAFSTGCYSATPGAYPGSGGLATDHVWNTAGITFGVP